MWTRDGHKCISLLFFQVLDVLCSLCVCNGVAVRSNQNLITENLLPGRDLLLQTNIINYVTRWVRSCEVSQYRLKMFSVLRIS